MKRELKNFSAQVHDGIAAGDKHVHQSGNWYKESKT
jgi:hypothetical protein